MQDEFDFAGTAPFQRHSDTSAIAAEKIEPKMGALQRRVLDFLEAIYPGGATDDEMMCALKLEGSTLRPRRIELVAKGLVIDRGWRRPTRSGRLATVWAVKPKEG